MKVWAILGLPFLFCAIHVLKLLEAADNNQPFSLFDFG